MAAALETFKAELKAAHETTNALYASYDAVPTVDALAAAIAVAPTESTAIAAVAAAADAVAAIYTTIKSADIAAAGAIPTADAVAAVVAITVDAIAVAKLAVTASEAVAVVAAGIANTAAAVGVSPVVPLSPSFKEIDACICTYPECDVAAITRFDAGDNREHHSCTDPIHYERLSLASAKRRTRSSATKAKDIEHQAYTLYGLLTSPFTPAIVFSDIVRRQTTCIKRY